MIRLEECVRKGGNKRQGESGNRKDNVIKKIMKEKKERKKS